MQINLPSSIQKLISLLEAQSDINNSMLKEFLIKANIKEADLHQYAYYDHPVNESYGRKLIYDGGRFNIVAVTWNQGDATAIHSHGYVDWGIVKYFGEAYQNIYNVEDDLLTLFNIQTMTNGSYEEIINDLIHQNGNSSGTPFISLHVYGSNSRNIGITDGTEIFDLEKMEIAVTTGTAYLNIPKNEILKTAKCPYPDKDTFFYNAILLLQYYIRQENTTYNKQIMSLLQRMADYYV